MIRAGADEARPCPGGSARAVGVAVALLLIVSPAALAAEPADELLLSAPDVARTALAEGRCDDAAEAADAVTTAHPELPLGWRLLGDAERCRPDRTREAVLAYRRYAELGGSDFQVLQALEALAGALGLVEVLLAAGAEVSPLLAKVDLPGGTSTATGDPGGRLLLRDLPIGRSLAIQVAGLGMETATVDVAPLMAGETRVVELQPRLVGTAEILVAGTLPADCSAVLVSELEERGLRQGDRVPVTAGAVLARVAGPNGSTEVQLVAEAGEVLSFDPMVHLPAELTIVGLPAGAEVRVFVESSAGGDVVRTVDVPPGVGEVDPDLGVRLAPPQRLTSLQGGSGGLFVTHPTLGGGTSTVALVGGEVNATTFDWRSMQGVPAVAARYEAWGQERLRAERGHRRSQAIGVGSAVLAGASAVLWAFAAGAQGDAQRQHRAGLDAAAAGGCAGPSPSCDDLEAAWTGTQAALARRDGLFVAGGISAGLSGFGLALTFTSEAVTRRAVARVGPWDPDADAP